MLRTDRGTHKKVVANFCLFQSSSQTESESPQLFLSRPFSWLRLRDASHCVTPIGGSSRRIVRWIHNLLTMRSSYIPNTLTRIDSHWVLATIVRAPESVCLAIACYPRASQHENGTSLLSSLSRFRQPQTLFG